jgi:hypothetical protein
VRTVPPRRRRGRVRDLQGAARRHRLRGQCAPGQEEAGGLPNQTFLVVTPTKVHAFKYGMKGRNYKLKDEVGVWDRAGLQIATEAKMGLTMLTISSPAEGETVTLAPGGVKDSPFTDDVINALKDGITQSPADG